MANTCSARGPRCYRPAIVDIEPSQRATRTWLPIAVLGVVFAGAIVFGLARNAQHSVGVDLTALVTTYDHPTNAVEVMLAKGDGQIFGALAQDPALARPRVFRYGPFDHAYRAQRPVLGYFVWGTSLGQRTLVPAAMVLAALLGAGLATGALARLTGGSRPWTATLLVLSPAGIATLYSLTPELLALGLALVGLLLWQRGHSASAAVVLTLAALGRETLLVFPLVMAIDVVVNGRDRRRLGALSVPFVAWGGWYVFVRAWLHQPLWPMSMQGDLGMPLVELLRAVPDWSGLEALTFALAVAAVVFAVIAVRAGRQPTLAWTAIAYGAAVTMFGRSIWIEWLNSGRLLVPLYALGLALIPWRVAAPRTDLGQASTR